MLTERKIRIAFEAWVADRWARELAESPSETAAHVRGHYRRRLRAGLAAKGSSYLAEALIELEGLVLEEAQICRWQLPRLRETILRLTEPLSSCTHATHT